MHFDSLRTRLALVLVSLALALAACGGGAEMEDPADTAELPPQLPGYAAMTIPAENAISAEKVALGKMLYYDERLSGDGNRSCYGCHLEEHGLTDGRKTALGAFDKQLTRNTPTMWNIGFHDAFYWDGRTPTLEKQVQGAWSGGNMGASGQDGAPSMEQVCANLMEIPEYQERFQQVFGEGCTPDNVGQAMASFMRTIVSSDSPWIRFRNGDESALSEEARRGYEIFSGKAKCTNCHDGLLLTDLQYHNVGIGMDQPNPDPGRAKVSGNEADTGAFKTPTLIDVAESGPYFHDGSVESLEEAVRLMSQGGKPNQYLDETNLADVKNANLTPEDEQAMVAFLREITAEYNIEEPELP